jgi:uncharacterized protein (TIRG00374 family)
VAGSPEGGDLVPHAPVPAAPSRAARILIAGLKAAVAIGLLAWLVATVGSTSLLHQLAAADPLFLLAAVAVVLGNLVLRAWRWRLLFVTSEAPGLWPSFVAIASGYLFNNLLPGRLGDLLRVIVLGELSRIAKGRVLASVLVERIADLLFACLLLFVTTRLRPISEWLNYAAAMVGAGGGVALLVLVGLALSRRRTTGLLDRALAFLPTAVHRLLAAIIANFLAGIADLLRLRAISGFLALTAVLWMTEGMVVHLCARALAIEITFAETLIVMLVAVFASFVPTGPGQLGVFEAGVVTAMATLGFETDVALALAVLWHALLLIATSAFGAVGLVAERRILGSVGWTKLPRALRANRALRA